MADAKKRKKEEEKEEEAEDVDPVVVFSLGPSEHIHLCVGLPSSQVPQGATPEQSYIAVVEWIHNTVTRIPGYSDKYSCRPDMAFQTAQINASNVHHHTFTRMPLVYQKVDAGMCAAITAAFQYPQWQAEATRAGVSLGILVITASDPPTSVYISCRPRTVGPFLAISGV